jgi:hypothetical protein
MRTLTIAALATLLATPALAADLPWTYHSGGSQYQGGRIVGGRSVSPKRHEHQHRRSYDRPRYRSRYQPRDQVIIIVPQYQPQRRYQPLFGGLRR